MSNTIKQPPVAFWEVSASFDAIPIGEVDTPVVTTLEDVSVTTYGQESYHYEFSTNLTSLREVTTTNLTPSVIDSAELPRIVRIATGIGKVRFENARSSLTRAFDLTDKVSGSTKRVSAINSGAAAHTWNLVKSAMDAGGSSGYLSDTNYGSGLTHSAGCWANDWDFSGMPVFHLLGFQGGGALITRRHLWVTHHFSKKSIGQEIRFLGSDNVEVSRTIIGVSTSQTPNAIFDSNPIKQDVVILTLSSDLPSAVKSYSVVGPWAYLETGTNEGVFQMSGIWLNRFRQAHFFSGVDSAPAPTSISSGEVAGVALTDVISWFRTAGNWSSLGGGMLSNSPTVFDDYSGFFVGPYYGDSGSMMGVPISSSGLAVATLLTSPNYGTFPDEDLLNACIASADSNAAISTGYTVTVAPDPTL